MPQSNPRITYSGRLITLHGPTPADPSVWTGLEEDGGLVYLSQQTVASLLESSGDIDWFNNTRAMGAANPVVSLVVQNTPVQIGPTPAVEPAPVQPEPVEPARPPCPACDRQYNGVLGVNHRCQRILAVCCARCRAANTDMLEEPARAAFLCGPCSQAYIVCKRCGLVKDRGHAVDICDACNPTPVDSIWENMAEKRALGNEVVSHTRSHRPFAVEIECFLMPESVKLTRTQLHGWDESDDGSIEADDGATEDREFRSPPFKGDKGLELLYMGAMAYRAMGFRANRTCGLHVHVDMTDTSESDRAALHKFGTWLQPDIYKLVSKSRFSGDRAHYCSPLGQYENDVTAKYKWLSIEAYNRHRTVEFRLHHGCTRPEIIVEWVKVCLRIVERGLKLGHMAAKPAGTIFELLDMSAYEKTFWMNTARKLYGADVTFGGT